jgi:pilus assembly protein CpaD
MTAGYGMAPIKPIGREGALRQRPAAAALAAGCIALALAGCAQRIDPYAVTGSVPEDYRTNHPILIQEQIATIDIPVSADSAHLTPQVRANVTFFAQSFLTSGADVIAVVAPSGSPNQVAAAAAAVEIEDVLRRAGVAARAIDYRVYRATAAERIAPVRLAYNRVAATTAPCRPWNDQLTVSTQNRHYGAYGCASQQNLAAMVTNPLDLLYPRGLSPSDAARRTDVLNKYRTGVETSSTATLSGGSIVGLEQ